MFAFFVTKKSRPVRAAALAVFLIFVLPSTAALACACGCGVFDVGTGSVLPTGADRTVWLEYNHMNQDQNWHGSSKAPAADNDDKEIRSDFYSAGIQYMINREVGVRAVVPYARRDYETLDHHTDTRESFSHNALGDVRLSFLYTGLSPDMSSGLSFGVKLPTGDYTQDGFDRDTAIGAGATDVLIGGWRMGRIGGAGGRWNWFTHGQWDQPVLTQDGYRPGAEINVAAGVYHTIRTPAAVKITPQIQLVGTWKDRDSGPATQDHHHGNDTGYTRLALTPGLEFDFGKTAFHADLGLPVYQTVNGDQLVPSTLFKLTVSRKF